MKLLSKRQINTDIARERKNQIDEGITLATKIDTLRRTLADLESQHKKFIDGMQGELELRTKDLLDNIAYLQREILELKEERKKLQIPLDSEWVKVTNKLSDIEKREIQIKKGLVVLAEKNKKADERYKKSKSTDQRINVRERELNKVYESQEKTLADIEFRNQQGIEEKERLDKYIEEKNKELLSREAEIAVKEREVGIARDHLERDRRELINRTALIQDREQTLERELKRKNNG